jgi:hypothetical protein
MIMILITLRPDPGERIADHVHVTFSQQSELYTRHVQAGSGSAASKPAVLVNNLTQTPMWVRRVRPARGSRAQDWAATHLHQAAAQSVASCQDQGYQFVSERPLDGSPKLSQCQEYVRLAARKCAYLLHNSWYAKFEELSTWTPTRFSMMEYPCGLRRSLPSHRKPALLLQNGRPETPTNAACATHCHSASTPET